MFAQLPALLSALLDALSAPSGARAALAALAALSCAAAARPSQLRRVLAALLDRFRGGAAGGAGGGAALLQRGGAALLRRLCAAAGPEPVFLELAAALDAEADLAFASTMAQALALILLTAPEARALRQLLRRAAEEPRGAAAFAALYRCMAHAAGALCALCLLAGAHRHAGDAVRALAALDVGADALVQVGR